MKHYEQRKVPEECRISMNGIRKIAADCNTYPVLVFSLLSRGLKDYEIRTLFSGERPVNVDTSLNGAENAADKILEYLKNGDNIGIFADYDCDGITSGYVMRTGLSIVRKELKSKSNIYLKYPQREEGYGINDNYCEVEAPEKNIKLVITVDNGIATKSQCELLRARGIEMIVTDHHEPKKKLLPNCTIVDPCYNDIERSYLAGVAVAYNVVYTIFKKVGLDHNDDLLTAVMIGTISDVMPFSYENAWYIKNGLENINENPNLLFQTINSIREETTPYTATDISFDIAPKINAASRMGNTNIGAAGFFLDDRDKIKEILKTLNEMNTERKKITASAKAEVSKIKIKDWQRFIAFDGSDYKSGTHGIIAGEISKKYEDYPAFVYEKLQDGTYAGSVRCQNEGLELLDMFKNQKHLGNVEYFAGHKNACILRIPPGKLKSFIKSFSEDFDKQNIPPVICVYDAKTSLKALSLQFLERIEEIPYTAQEVPVFCIPHVVISQVHESKNNPDNIKLTISDTTAYRNVWAWGFGEKYKKMGSPKYVSIICSLCQDFMFKHKKKETLRIIDIIPEGDDQFAN